MFLCEGIFFEIGVDDHQEFSDVNVFEVFIVTNHVGHFVDLD